MTAVNGRRSDPMIVIDKSHYLPSTWMVKQCKVAHGRYTPIRKYRLVVGGSGTIADGIAGESRRFDEVMKRNLEKLRAKAQADGFAPMDVLLG